MVHRLVPLYLDFRRPEKIYLQKPEIFLVKYLGKKKCCDFPEKNLPIKIWGFSRQNLPKIRHTRRPSSSNWWLFECIRIHPHKSSRFGPDKLVGILETWVSRDLLGIGIHAVFPLQVGVELVVFYLCLWHVYLVWLLLAWNCTLLWRDWP